MSLSIVVPTYNEESTLEDVIYEILEVQDDLPRPWEIIIVDDGSTDNTKTIIDKLTRKSSYIRSVRHDTNQGSGRGIRTGITAARYDYVIYIPADGQFDPREISKFYAAARDAEIVIGARLDRHDYTWFRLFSSRVFLILVRVLFGTNVRDVNWVHLWKRSLFEMISPRSKGVFLLEEILVLANRAGLRIREVDSVYRPRQGGHASGGNISTILKTILEMISLKLKLSLPIYGSDSKQNTRRTPRSVTAVKGHKDSPNPLSDATVLFSGGTDSTLAAVRMLEEGRNVVLLTLDPGFIFFVENSKRHVPALKNAFGTERVSHKILDSSAMFKQVFLRDFFRDLKRFGPSMMVQLCHGCRLSMHAAAIIFNLEHGIRYLVDGSIRKQSVIPEQMECVLESNRKFYESEFGITSLSPIYDIDDSDRKLDELGLALKKELKRQFILFDTQPTCPFGVPADVYARLFYKRAFCDCDRESLAYNTEKHHLMKNLVYSWFANKGEDIQEKIGKLRKLV